MHFKKKILLPIIAVLLLFTWQCSSALYKPMEADYLPGTNVAELKQGRAIYVDHCGSCHMLHLPQEFNAQQWNKYLGEMSVKAGLTEADKDLVYRYLTSVPKKPVK